MRGEYPQSTRANGAAAALSRAQAAVVLRSPLHAAVALRSRRAVEAVRSRSHAAALTCGSSRLATTTIRFTLPAW